jgi:hypothetical protein
LTGRFRSGGPLTQLGDGGLELSDALSRATQFPKVLSFPRFGLLEADESVASDRFVARGLRA